ncbi:MAG: hypothetical protein M1820_010709 [Bogoriella megaspora]|nr:MAG: hypothetical protein M1820_010709 [Bogoriella megaspora]
MSGSSTREVYNASLLKVVNLQALLDDDQQERDKLFAAVKDEGFFYLDFRHVEGSSIILELLEDMFRFQEELFSLPDDQKTKYDVDTLSYMKLNGYKPKGRNKGGVENRDGFESWAIPKDGALGISNEQFSRPDMIDANMGLVQGFMKHMLTATGTIHASLSKALALDVGQRFEDYHRAAKASPCLLRMLKYHPQPIEERGPPQTPHTDLGSLTILFTKQPGLQVLPKGAHEWAFVEPKSGHAIVNVGDGLSMMTNGLFQSCLHRVSPLPDQSMQTRYSIAYLQRAEAHTRLTGLDSPAIPNRSSDSAVETSGEWLDKKFRMLRAKTHSEDNEWILTGRSVPVPV